MTTPQGPACDICHDEPSVMSVMNLADHEQLLIGSGCLVTWLQGMLGMLTGAEEDAETPDAAGPPSPEADAAGAAAGEGGAGPGDSGPAPPGRPRRKAAAK